jgi:type IV secretory pathway TraG/TraD family ATPase VirD4
MTSTPTLPRDGRDHALFAILGCAVLDGVLWLAGETSARVSGHPAPHADAFAPLRAFGHPGNPTLVWHASVGPATLYWAVTTLFLVVFAVLVWAGLRLFRREGNRATSDPTKAEGLADRRQVAASAGPKPLMARGRTLRPSIDKPRPQDVGYRLGASRGVACWASVEDSMLLLGPPRSGKGHNVVIPMILDAPGAVVTTSTRPDNLTVTLAARSSGDRPVAVFDPQGLAPAGTHLPSLRWSPVRGCERPQTAMVRAAALVSDSAGSVENGTFWQQQTVAAVRCLLHAAALDDRPPADLYRWSHAAGGAREAVTILTQTPGATPGWDRALDAIISADQRTRDSVWAMVANTFSPLADPAVLAAVTPAMGEAFDPAHFLAAHGTLYLLGTASGSNATANFVAALVEDVVDAARRMAARSTGARLDPPLALVLDEAANYPLPSLPALMSEGGGTGITTLAVLQSLAQARDKWGQEAAGAIWDSAIVKLILGGSANADDLSDISRLIGDRAVHEWSETHGAGPQGRSVSMQIRQRPILEPAEIRRIKLGHGLLLLRSAPPIMMRLSPWTDRDDANELARARSKFEAAMQAGANHA